MRVLHSHAWESRNCLQYPVAAALSYQVSGGGLSIDPTSFCPFLFSPFSFFFFCNRSVDKLFHVFTRRTPLVRLQAERKVVCFGVLSRTVATNTAKRNKHSRSVHFSKHCH